MISVENSELWQRLICSPLPTAYGPDSRPPMAIFELLDYIVNEVSVQTA